MDLGWDDHDDVWRLYLRDRGRDTDEDRQRQRTVLVALVAQADAASTQGNGARERALRALAEATESFDHFQTPSTPTPFPLIETKEFFDEASAVLLAAAADPMDAIREQALLALGKLATDKANGKQLWDDENGARESFLIGAADGQPEGIRYASHYALSLLVCHNATAALQYWSHARSRAVVLSTIRSDEGGGVVSLRVKLEAWDVLLNAVSLMWNDPAPTERARCESLFRLLWQESEDVRGAIVAACCDVAEHEQAQVKALECVLQIVCWHPMVAFTWEQQPVVRAILALATNETFVHARGLAIKVLLKLVSSDEAPCGTRDGAAVVAALLAAAEGPAAVLDTELRQRCATEHDRLELLAAAHSGEPLRTQPRYAALGVDERLKRLRAIWRRVPDGGAPPDLLQIPLRVDTISEDLLRYVGELDARHLVAGVRSVRVKLDHGSDAGGLRRHAFSEFGKGLLELEGVSHTSVALAAAKGLLKKWKPYSSSQHAQERELLRKLQAEIATAIADNEADEAEGATAKLFKLTDQGSLVPSGAESLSKCVGKATEGAPEVPEVSPSPLPAQPLQPTCAHQRLLHHPMPLHAPR